MSWGEYLANLQRDGLKSAAICGKMFNIDFLKLGVQ